MGNGLSADDVRSVYQDKDGFMWFGTQGGIDRYDGKDFSNYYKMVRDTSVNIMQGTFGIREDSYGNIWFINDTNGLVMMSKLSETIVRFTHHPDDPSTLSNNRVRSIFEDSRKNLWFITAGGGLNRFNRKDSSFSCYRNIPGDPASIGSNILSSIVEDDSGILWISSPEGLLIKFDPVNHKFKNIKITDSTPFMWTQIISPVLYIDNEKKIWYGHRQFLYMYNDQNQSVQQFEIIPGPMDAMPFTFITSILEIRNSQLLITTYNDGLYLFNSQTSRIDHYRHNPGNPFGISSNHLSGSFQSRDSVVWISSYDNGINVFSSTSLRFPRLVNLVNADYLKYSNISTYCLLEIPDGQVIMGTENNGLLIYDPDKRSIMPFLPELQDISIYDLCYHQGQIWIAAWLNGLYCYDMKAGSLEKITQLPGLNAAEMFRNVVRIYFDKKDRMWLGGMSSGLLMYDRNNRTSRWFISRPDDPGTLTANMIFKIFEDSYNRIWIGTSSGLNYYNEARNMMPRLAFQDEKGSTIAGILIGDIFEDSRKQIWIGTNRALYRYIPGTEKMRNYPFKVNDSYLSVFKINSDKKGRLWLGTNEGICRFDPVKEEYKHYGYTDGIHYFSNNPNSGMKAANGDLYFGTSKGVILFNPLLIREDTYLPPVVITGMTVNDIPLNIHRNHADSLKGTDHADYLELNYKQSTISFRFAALDYSNPESNRYAYKLIGYDSDWVQNGNNNQASYRNLPPGKYKFVVIGSNSHGYWNNRGKEIIILIKTPFWKTRAFRMGLVLLMFSFILLIYFIRIGRLRYHKTILEETVEVRTKALNDANLRLTQQHDEVMQQHEEISAQNERLSQLSSEIKKQNEELEQHRNHLEKLIIERTGELEIALRKAEESDQLKSAFLANMSHEIRTPMNAIVGFANLLKENNLEPSERNEFIEIINANSETLLVLIDDILDLSLIEANQLSIREEYFSLNEILDHLYSSYSIMNRKKELSIRLNNTLHDLNIRIHSDRVRVKQVLSNLMSNAYKFTEKGFVELGAMQKAGALILYVTDTGIGISPKEINAIFERFRKNENQSDTLYRGTGLGLAISKALAKLLKGNLTVESLPGKGSTFYLYLPWEQTMKDIQPLNQSAVPKSLQKWTGRKVLIVEDEKANYLYARKMLDKMDVEVHWAENGLEAIKLASSDIQFDVILMDIKMPVIDGYEATKTIKSNNPGQVIIALTAYARPEDRLHFMNAGFDDYLSKPIKPNDFIGVMRRYL